MRNVVDKFNYSDSLLGSIYIFLGKDKGPGRSWASKSLMVFYMVFSYIVVAYYNADLTASLTVQQRIPIVNQLSDLALSGLKFAVRVNSASESYFKQPGFEAYLPQMVTKNNYQLCLDALTSGEVQAVIADSITQEFISNSLPCDKWVVGEVFAKSNFGIGLAYANDTTIHQISEAILSLRESGVIDDIRNSWLQAGACDSSSELYSTRLTLEDLSGAFVVLGVFIFIAIISLIIENLFYKWYITIDKPGISKHFDRFFGNSEPQDKNRSTVQ